MEEENSVLERGKNKEYERGKNEHLEERQQVEKNLEDSTFNRGFDQV